MAAALLALLISDRHADLDLTSALRLLGYQVDQVYTLETASRAARACIPDLVVAGPFDDDSGLRPLLRRLHALAVQVVVVSDKAETVALATQLGMRVRTSAANVLLPV